MIVEFDLSQQKCFVVKEKNDRRISKSGYNGTVESTFLYLVKQNLKAQGYGLIKKRMVDDGHRVDDRQQYIRTKSWKGKKGEFYIFNSNFAIEDAGEMYNKYGYYYLMVGE
jgi:hypothetical protein